MQELMKGRELGEANTLDPALMVQALAMRYKTTTSVTNYRIVSYPVSFPHCFSSDFQTNWFILLTYLFDEHIHLVLFDRSSPICVSLSPKPTTSHNSNTP
jgi:hypothetical protein